MPVTLRLQRRGQTKRPFYRIVAADSQARRDGRYLEIVGTYNPMLNPPAVNLKADRIEYWVATGASQSAVVRSLIKKQIPGLVESKEEKRKATVKAKQEKRKAQVAKRKPRVARKGAEKKAASKKSGATKSAK